MTNKRKLPVFDLDEEEQAISDSFDRGELKSAANIKEEMFKAREAASNYLRKDARINIAIIR